MNNPLRIAKRRGLNFAGLFFLASIFFSGVLSVYAQASSGAPEPSVLRLSPETAVDMAIKNNLMLEMAKIGTDIKERKSRLVWNEFLPNLALTGTLSRSNYAASAGGLSAIPNTGTYVTMNGIKGWVNPNILSVAPFDLPRWNVLGNFSADLTFSFALIEGIKSIKQDYQAGLVGLSMAKLKTEQGIRKMYNSILLLEANFALLKESFENAKRQASMAEANFRAGLAPRLVWLQAQVAAENIKPAMNDLENTLKNLKGSFALLLGLSYDASFELEEVQLGAIFVPPDVEEFISRSASGKPDIHELQANLVTMHTQRKALRLQAYTPFLRFGWTLSTMFNPMLDPFNDNLFTRDNWNGGGNFSVTLGWSISSLFSFTKEGQQRKDLDAGIQVQNIALAQMIRETELEIFTKLNSLENIRASKEAQQATVDLAEQSYRLTEEAYRAGLQDFQSVQNAALAFDQAKLQLLTQQFNYLNDLIDLEYSIGVPFGTLSSSGTK